MISPSAMDDLEEEIRKFCKCGHSLAMHHGTLFECGETYYGDSGSCRCKGYEEAPPPKTWHERLESE
jgi:hypothetical protein